MSVRLEWDGKPTKVERLSLPFQTVETINESRATRERDVGALFGTGERDSTWRNQLIWGDNKLVMSSLLKEFAGQVKLVYIDPPFDTGMDFSVRVPVGDTKLTKAPSILEEHAYRDTWGAGRASYLRMLYERLGLIHELIADGGRLFLHLGPNVSHYVKVLCDEVFGSESFVNEIIWQRTISKSLMSVRLPSNHDVVFAYQKGAAETWHEDAVFQQYDPENLDERTASKYTHHDDDGRVYRLDNLTNPNPDRPNLTYEFLGVTRVWRWTQERMHAAHDAGLVIQTRPGTVPQLKRYLDEQRGRPVGDVWTDIPPLNSQAMERVGYDTQKPEALVERILELTTDPGDLVADVFVGSGTTAAVAEKLGRRWIACDLGRFAIHTTRKRLLNIPDCRPFEIRNLGSYERQHWRQDTGNGALRGYLDTILAFYRAEPVEGFQHLHGRKAGRMVHVGATDAPVTIDEAEEVMDELADNGIESCDLLGWEWEMGLHDTIGERARRRGLDVRVLQIPREVMERTVQEADAVRFFELAHVDLDVKRQQRESKVVLKDFAIPSEDLIPAQVRERITRWSDLIDYWSVDFDHRDGVFHNQWQSYRTRVEPVLATESHWHEYPQPGTYAIVVKIIDIFGNDTTKLAEVTIKCDPFAVPERRAPSDSTHLVNGVRAAVDAWRANGYPGASATTRRLLRYWFDDEHRTQDGSPFRFYFCQREAVETFIYLAEVERVRSFRDLLDYASQGILIDPAETKRPRLAFKMATGSGKTMAMSLCVVWSYFHALFEEGSPMTTAFLLIAPNVIVFERLKVDYGDGATFRHDPLVPPEWEEDWELTVLLQDVPAPVTTRGVLYLTNVHRLYEAPARKGKAAPNPVEAMLGPRVNRDVDAASAEELFKRIATHDRLMVINDEAHHVWSEKLKWNETIERLHAALSERGGGVVSQLDFSATPKNQKGQIFRHVVVDYPLKQAVDDGIVKTPLIGEITGAVVELGDSAAQRYRQWLDVAVGRWRKFHETLSPSGKRPVLFVMCENTQAADEVGDYLRQRPDFAGDRLLVIHTNQAGEITKADLDVARKAAREIDGPDSNVRCIVSVLMLREGWDVRNVCVVVTLRSLTAKAKILPEQALGRGLRRMTPPGSGFDERVVVIEHDAFRDLWSSELDGGLVVEREDADKIEPGAVTIFVDGKVTLTLSKMATERGQQIDLFAWARELEDERERVDAVNEERARRRGFLVFATDPSVDPDAPEYRQVYATEADTPAKAVAKVRPLASGRRLRAYLATGHYSDQLAEARWVA